MLTALEIVCLVVIAILLWPLGDNEPIGDPFMPPKDAENEKKTTPSKTNGMLPSTKVPIKPSMSTLRDRPYRFEKGNATGRPKDPITTRLIQTPRTDVNFPRDTDPTSSKNGNDSFVDIYNHTDLVDQKRY